MSKRLNGYRFKYQAYLTSKKLKTDFLSVQYSSTPTLHIQHATTKPTVSDLPARLPSSRGGWGPEDQRFSMLE